MRKAVDGNGAPVPDSVAMFFREGGMNHVVCQLNCNMGILRQCKKWNPHITGVILDDLLDRLRKLRDDVQALQPWIAFPQCNGDGCPHCWTIGWLPKSRAEVKDGQVEVVGEQQ